MHSDPKVVLGAPSPAVLAGVRDSWERDRKRAKVLLVLDVSGSMGETVGSEGASKLDLAKKAAAASVGLLAKDDQLALWVFSTEQDGDKPYRQLVPFGAAGTQAPIVRRMIADLQPDGGTGLYATARAANRAMTASFDRS